MTKLPHELFALSETEILKQTKRILLFCSFFLTAVGHLSAQTFQVFRDGAVSGEVSFTHGPNAGHSVMAIAPNGIMTFSGPVQIDPRYDFGMLAVESQWIDNNGKVNDEFYFTTNGNLRVVDGGRNVTDGTSALGVFGSLWVDATQAGLRNPTYNPTAAILDDQAGFASVSVMNTNSKSKGAQLILGAANVFDALGWSLREDPGANGTHAFAIQNRVTNTFPFQINSSGQISLGFTGLHSATKPVEFADPKGARAGLNIYSAYKTSDLGRSNTTASVDPDLTVTLQPGIWKVSADLFFTVSGGTPGFWAYFNTSGGSTRRDWSRWTFPDSANGTTVKTYTFNALGNSTGAFESIGPATGTGGYFVKGEALVMVTSTTSLQLYWGQWSPQGQTTTLLAPSCIVATRID
jgi:hypothetical protein